MTSMATNARQDPSGGQQIMDKKQFIDKVVPGSHLAEKRTLGYYHHSLVIQVQNTSVEIIHYAPEASGIFPKVHTKKLTPDKMNFELGVYLIYSNGYPKSQEERKAAIRRACSRLKEENYYAAINNCEHFVTWALTGTPFSQQIADGTRATILAADTVDACCNKKAVIHIITSAGTSTAMTTLEHGNKGNMPVQNGANTVVNPVVGTAGTSSSLAVGETLVIAAAVTTGGALIAPTVSDLIKETAVKTAGKSVTQEAAAKTAEKAMAKTAGTSVTPKVIVSQTSAKSAALKTVGKAAIVATVIETPILIKEIYDLTRLYEAGKITKRDRKRGIITKISGTLGSISGGSVGAGIGQALIPVPVVGGLVGGVVGSLFTRWASSTATGIAFDNA